MWGKKQYCLREYFTVIEKLIMKRTNTQLKLKRRLELVRTTVRELTPEQLAQVNGGNTEKMASASCVQCCELTY